MLVLRSVFVVLSGLAAIGCERPDPRARATAEAAARAARMARYDLEDRTLTGQPGAPSEAPAPQAPAPRMIDQLVADVAAEVEGFFAQAPNPQALAARVQAAIVAEPAVNGGVHELQVEMENGRVVLRGWVRNAADRALAGERARGIAGDENVDNRLEIR